MAGIPGVSARRHYVVDTGYLDELFSIDGKSKPASVAAVKEKFKSCIDARDILYVPFTVLFEIGRHIVEIKHDVGRRRILAGKLRDTVVSSIAERQPWVILGGDHAATRLVDSLQNYCDEFADHFAEKGETLTDVAVIREARLLKDRLSEHRDRRRYVHIWTRDRAVKGSEPDREDAPFV